jgi:fused signal recognition particle receptor
LGVFANLKGRLGGLFASGGRADAAFYEGLEETLILSDTGAPLAARLIAQVKKSGAKTAAEAREALRGALLELLAGGGELNLTSSPAVILLLGVNGAGKTTTAGKLAALLAGQGKKVILCAADTFRAAAGEQLSIWAERAGAQLVRGSEGADPAAVLFDAVRAAVSR